MSHNIVDCIYKDRTGNMWLGTSGGLNLFKRKTQSFIAYTEKQGIANNHIRGILEDDRGNLWISTNKGLSKLNPTNGIFRNYGVADGLQGEEFKPRSCYESENGEMFFGGSNGFNAFFPQRLTDNTDIPPVYITDFQIFNKSIKVGNNDSILHQHISSSRQILLSYDQSVLTFEFAALNYTMPEKNQYAYRLKGFDKDWNYVNSKRTATYTNLQPGEYLFHVKASNNDGAWNEKGTSLKIIVTPPFWLTWWFRISVIILIAGGVYLYITIRIGDIKKTKKELEKQVNEKTAALIAEREEADKARQDAERANQAKSIFLATMSHEIRTPMNGVLGMASLLSETPLNTEQQEYTDTIRTSGEALLTVINDILDFSKIESGRMEMEQKDFDLRTCVEEVLDVFSSKAAKTGLDLIYEIDNEVPSQIVGDSVRLRQVILNLVSNAIKFTHHGEIFVGVHLLNKKDGTVELGVEVRDTGIGIPEDKLHRLFKAFSQVDSSTTRQYGGTGLGLVICEKLVGLMGGQIRVESVAGKGTTFTFNIKTTASQHAIRTYVHQTISSIEGKKVLIVDDNETNRNIFKNQLEQWKLVPTLAASGKEGLEILEQIPDFDLVLSDMQMPEMNGVQLARCIRKIHESLPIILLSSIGEERFEEQQKLFASVLTKPVKQHILFKHIIAQLGPQKNKIMAEEIVSEKKLSADFAHRYPLRILIAEDNPINQKLAERVLTKLGYSPDMAMDGREALNALDKKEYDVILMDVQMPTMDGLEATREIRKRRDSQPLIIAMTANAMQGDREICIQAGMDDYISKPIKLENLVILLEKYALQIKG